MLSDAIKSQLSILRYARDLGYTPVPRSRTNYYLKEMDSISINVDKGLFIRNSDKSQTGSVIDFAIQFGGYRNSKEAIMGLAREYGIVDRGYNYSNNFSNKNKVNKNEVKPKQNVSPQEQGLPKADFATLPPRVETVKNVEEYLKNVRKIDKSIVDFFLRRGMVYQDQRNNCVFVSPDKKFGCIRSTGNKKFVRDLENSDYNECFFYSPTPNKLDSAKKTLVVTESVIDMMSVMTQLKKEGLSARDFKFLALSGTSKIQSLYYHLNKPENGNINRVMLALDRDIAGKKAIDVAKKMLKEDLSFNGIVEEYLPPEGYKDWNEYIQNTSEISKEVSHGEIVNDNSAVKSATVQEQTPELDSVPEQSEIKNDVVNEDVSKIEKDPEQSESNNDTIVTEQEDNNLLTDEEMVEYISLVKEEQQVKDVDIEQLTPKEKMAFQLEKGLRSILDSDNFKNWLVTQNKAVINNVSLRNALLIFAQKPTATYTMGYEQWKEFGRSVLKGATGIKIYAPIFLEKSKAKDFANLIYKELKDQSAKDDRKTAIYKVNPTLSFTMNPNNKVMGVLIRDKEQAIIGTFKELHKFIENKIACRFPIKFRVTTHFDVQDTYEPDYLFVNAKSNYNKKDIIKDEKGKPIKNNKGQIKIINSDERKARFNPKMSERVNPNDKEKMSLLFDVCKTVSERNGIPVYIRTPQEDEILKKADGYYSREFTDEHPKGYIVISDNLDITNKCSVILHEIAHSELHRNIEKLKNELNVDRVSHSIRELQAEATAFSVAQNFGLETDTSSFKYIATYAKGFDMQELKQSLDVIYRETESLTNAIEKELNERGYNLDLTEKNTQAPMLSSEQIKSYTQDFMTVAISARESAMNSIKELPYMMQEHYKNSNIATILKTQNALFQNQLNSVRVIFDNIEVLNNATKREEQDKSLELLNSAKKQILTSRDNVEKLTEEFIKESNKVDAKLKIEFNKDPLKVLKELSKSDSRLAELSPNQLKYIATSKYISAKYGKFIRTNLDAFISNAVERAKMIGNIASNKGVFVEINRCEQWTDKPFFKEGTLCSPAVANKIFAECEHQARELMDIAKEKGEEFPPTLCQFTIYVPNDNSLEIFSSSVDIGDGLQNDLKDNIEQWFDTELTEELRLKACTEILKDSFNEKANKKCFFEPSVTDYKSRNLLDKNIVEQSKSDNLQDINEVERLVTAESARLKGETKDHIEIGKESKTVSNSKERG